MVRLSWVKLKMKALLSICKPFQRGNSENWKHMWRNASLVRLPNRRSLSNLLPNICRRWISQSSNILHNQQCTNSLNLTSRCTSQCISPSTNLSINSPSYLQKSQLHLNKEQTALIAAPAPPHPPLKLHPLQRPNLVGQVRRISLQRSMISGIKETRWYKSDLRFLN